MVKRFSKHLKTRTTEKTAKITTAVESLSLEDFLPDLLRKNMYIMGILTVKTMVNLTFNWIINIDGQKL